MTEAKLSCDVIMLATPEIDEYSRHSRALWSAYCVRKGYQFHHYSNRMVPDMHVNWSKIEMVRRHLAKSNADVITLVDADTYVCNPDMSLTDMLDNASPKTMLFAPDTTRNGIIELPLNFRAALEHRTMRLPNAGFIVMKNSPFARQFFDDWLDLARHELKHLSDTHPRNQLVLWKGLYFQNKARISLLKGEVRRLQTDDQLDQAMKAGCDVAHVRDGMSHATVERLIQNFQQMPFSVSTDQKR